MLLTQLFMFSLHISNCFFKEKITSFKNTVRARVFWKASDFDDPVYFFKNESQTNLNMWVEYEAHPNDPSLSCYYYDDKWYCINDNYLKSTLNSEDSY